MLRPKLINTIGALDEAAVKGERLASSVSGAIDNIGNASAAASSQRLVATLGAGAGAAGAILLAAATAVPFVIAAPVFVAIGGAVGALGWRGGNGVRAEKELHYRTMLLKGIRDEIESLPASAPPEVVAGLWSEYESVATGYGRRFVGRLQAPNTQIQAVDTPAGLLKPGAPSGTPSQGSDE